MKEIISTQIAQKRQAIGLTVNELATQLAVSVDTLTAWEKGCLTWDIYKVIPQLTEILKIPLDKLIFGKDAPVFYVPTLERKNTDTLTFRIIAENSRGSLIRMNIPMPLAKWALQSGIESIPKVAGMRVLQQINIAQLITMAENGIMGQLLERRTASKESVVVYVE